MARNQVRIVGGAWRSRRLKFPVIADLRPTPDRVRETLFNWLGQRLDALACLDLYAGSGALGFEAASRGAAPVVLVERDARATRALEESRLLLGASMVEIVQADALAFLASDRRDFDVVFLDPPYRLDLLPKLLAALPSHLRRNARVYLEAPQPPEIPAGYTLLRRARAGRVQCLLLQWRADERPL